MTDTNLPHLPEPKDQTESAELRSISFEHLNSPDFRDLFREIITGFGLMPLNQEMMLEPEKILWLLPKLQKMFAEFKDAPLVSGNEFPEVEIMAQAFNKRGLKFVLLKVEDEGQNIVPNKRSKTDGGVPAYFEKFESKTRLLVKKSDTDGEPEITPIFSKPAFKELVKSLAIIGAYLDSKARPETALPSDIPVPSYLFEQLMDEMEVEMDRLGVKTNSHFLLENIERIYIDENKTIHLEVEAGEYGPVGSNLFGYMGNKQLHFEFQSGLDRTGVLHSVCIGINGDRNQGFSQREAA